MKLSLRIGLVSLLSAAAITTFAVSCSDDDDEAAPVTEASSTGKDVTQSFTLEISNLLLGVPTGTFAAGSTVSLKTVAQPTEFSSAGSLAIINAGSPVELKATDASGAAIIQTETPLTAIFTINPFTSLTGTTKTAANICVLGKGADGTILRWPNSSLSIANLKITMKTRWFGTYQALYCGNAFSSYPAVNAAGTEIATTTTTPDSGSSATTDGTCNKLENVGTAVTATATEGGTPSGSGGDAQAGTYALTSLLTYEGSPVPPSYTLAQTLQFTSPTDIQVVGVQGDQSVVRESFIINTSGTTVLTRTCVTDEANQEVPYTSYTATADSITFYSSAYQIAVTYAKKK